MENEKSLFIPLKREWYEAFASGGKTVEYRPAGGRWNERTCRIGRPVTLSLGYGKQHRMHGVVVGFMISDEICATSIWKNIYGDKSPAACIEIKLNEL